MRHRTSPCSPGAIGLIAFSDLHARRGDRARTSPATRYYYVIRQAIYAVVGIALMFAVARVDYSRFRELRVGIYSAMIASICLVLVFGEATRGSRRWIELPFFRFQPSELGKVLLIVALAAFVLERASASAARRAGRSAAGLGIDPGGDRLPRNPTSAPAWCYGVITLAVLFIAGIAWKHFAAHRRCVAAHVVAIVLVVAPAARYPDPAAVPGGTTHRLPQSQRGPRRTRAIRSISALIAIGSGGKTGRGDEATQDAGRLPARAPHGLHLRRRSGSASDSSGPRSYCPFTPCSSGGRCAS